MANMAAVVDSAVVKTMADCIAAKAAEDIPLHPDVADVETGEKLNILPDKADPLVAQRWVLAMMQGKDSPLYAAFQPGAKGGKVDPSQREVTFEELLVRSADRSQQFPLVVAMHLSHNQRRVLKVWEMFMCDERRATHRSQKNFNMLPDDVVEMQHLIVLALKGKDHCVEWQEFAPPSSPAQYPKKCAALGQSHWTAMDTLTVGNVRQAIDDVSVASVDKEFCKDGHPYTSAEVLRPEVIRNICQLKLDLKDATVMYQELPIMTNPNAAAAFRDYLIGGKLQVKPEFVETVTKNAVQLMRTFTQDAVEPRRHSFKVVFTVEGSYQNKDIKGCETGDWAPPNRAIVSSEFLHCDFQGCETNDWAERMSKESEKKAFVAMTQFLRAVKNDTGVACLVQVLLQTLDAWQTTSTAAPDTTASATKRQRHN
jgi:hypothetical protein